MKKRRFKLVVNEIGQSIMSYFVVFEVFGYQLRIHRFFSGDGDWYHSHPRSFVSICRSGSYKEKYLKNSKIIEKKIKAGSVNFRNAKTAHNVTPIKFPCVTVAIVTPVIRELEKFKLV